MIMNSGGGRKLERERILFMGHGGHNPHFAWTRLGYYASTTRPSRARTWRLGIIYQIRIDDWGPIRVSGLTGTAIIENVLVHTVNNSIGTFIIPAGISRDMRRRRAVR